MTRVDYIQKCTWLIMSLWTALHLASQLRCCSTAPTPASPSLRHLPIAFSPFSLSPVFAPFIGNIHLPSGNTATTYLTGAHPLPCLWYVHASRDLWTGLLIG